MADLIDMIVTDGLERGRLERNIEIAKNMLKDNLPIDAIAKYTNLDMLKVQGLQRELSV